MSWLMTQRMSEDGKENMGGLFIRTENISEIMYERDLKLCRISMMNGLTYLVVGSMSELLNEVVYKSETS